MDRYGPREIQGGGGKLCEPTLLQQLEAAGALPIPDTVRRAFSPATHTVKEWQTYWLRLPGVDVLRVGDQRLQPAAFDLFPLRYENQLGLSTIRAEAQGRPLGSPATVEVLSPKFPDAASHQRFLSALLSELYSIAARLPFAISSSTARGVEPTAAEPGPLFLLHFLSQFSGEIRSAVAAVTAGPHRDLCSVDTLLPLIEISELDADSLLGILEQSEEWAPAPALAIADRLGGVAPAAVRQCRPDETTDTVPNRFVKSFLLQLTRAIGTLPDQEWWDTVSHARRQEITQLGADLRRELRAPLFLGVGEMVGLPDPALARREGYRELMGLRTLFQSARRPLFGPLERAIALRDIAALYEYWVFFRLVEEIGVMTGSHAAGLPEIRLAGSGGLAWRADVTFPPYGKLIYNQPYAADAGEYSSYSVPLRPDFTWVVAGKPTLVLDAKFRLDRPPTREQADAKHEDLHKAHAYRDALGVRAAVVIYPGDQSVFYGRDRVRGSRKKDHPPTSLTDILRGKEEGVAVLALRPS